MKIFYKTSATATGGRDGRTQVDDGSIGFYLVSFQNDGTGADEKHQRAEYGKHRRKTAAWGGWKTYSWFGLILHEDAFEYGFIGRTGLYLVLKKQAEGLSDTQMPVSFILLILLIELYYFQ